MRLFWIGVGVVGLVGACADAVDLSTARIETVVDTVRGTVHVSNSGATPVWTAERIARLGSIEGGPEEFVDVRSLLADGDGNIYIADNLAHEIRIFTSQARYLRSIGRQGAGPGEFGDLYSLAWLGAELAAMDPRNARIAVLSREGKWVDQIRHFPISGPPDRVRLHPLGDDGFYALIIDAERRNLPFARITSTGPKDTIPPPQPPAGARTSGVICTRPDGGITGLSLPEAPRLVYDFPPPGGTMAVSWTKDYRISFIGSNNDTLRVLTRDRPPLPYTDELWEEGMRPYRQLHEDFPGSQCEPRSPRRPEHRAAVRHILFDELGRLWVEAAAADGFLWEVFDTEGRLLGAVPAPDRAQGIPPYVRNNHLYQVERDDLNIQYVSVYRIDTEG